MKYSVIDGNCCAMATKVFILSLNQSKIASLIFESNCVQHVRINCFISVVKHCYIVTVVVNSQLLYSNYLVSCYQVIGTSNNAYLLI